MVLFQHLQEFAPQILSEYKQLIDIGGKMRCPDCPVCMYDWHAFVCSGWGKGYVCTAVVNTTYIWNGICVMCRADQQAQRPCWRFKGQSMAGCWLVNTLHFVMNVASQIVFIDHDTKKLTLSWPFTALTKWSHVSISHISLKTGLFFTSPFCCNVPQDPEKSIVVLSFPSTELRVLVPDYSDVVTDCLSGETRRTNSDIQLFDMNTVFGFRTQTSSLCLQWIRIFGVCTSLHYIDS